MEGRPIENSPSSSLRSHSDYEESEEEEAEEETEARVPEKTAVSEAIFKRYQAQRGNSAIR